MAGQAWDDRVDHSEARRLRAGRTVRDAPSASEGVERLLDREQDRGLELRQRAARADRDRDGSHRDVVRRLPERVAVVAAEGVPEPMELAADRLDVRRGR